MSVVGCSCTLGSFASLNLFIDRILSNLCNKLESVRNALLISFPACSTGNVVEGGFLIIETVSVATCFRKKVKVAAERGVF